MKLEHNDYLTLHLGWARKETLKSSLQESMLLCFCWPMVGPRRISEILQHIIEAQRYSSTVKEEMFRDCTKAQFHRLSGFTSNQTGNFWP